MTPAETISQRYKECGMEYNIFVFNEQKIPLKELSDERINQLIEFNTSLLNKHTTSNSMKQTNEILLNILYDVKIYNRNMKIIKLKKRIKNG